jgi:hypothetical protein
MLHTKIATDLSILSHQPSIGSHSVGRRCQKPEWMYFGSDGANSVYMHSVSCACEAASLHYAGMGDKRWRRCRVDLRRLIFSDSIPIHFISAWSEQLPHQPWQQQTHHQMATTRPTRPRYSCTRLFFLRHLPGLLRCNDQNSVFRRPGFDSCQQASKQATPTSRRFQRRYALLSHFLFYFLWIVCP